MKKCPILTKICALCSTLLLAACGFSGCSFGTQTSESESSNQSSQSESVGTGEHVHALSRVSERQATCKTEGNITYWACDCGSFFLDEAGTEVVTEADVRLAKTAHVLTNVKGIEPTCGYNGRREYWSCSVCKTNYADEAGTEELKISQLLLEKASHNLSHHEEIAIDDRGNRVMEHWTCSSCDGYFADAAGTTEITQEDTILFSALSIPDFVVEVPVGRDPVVLQLSDTQIIDAAQARPGRTGVDYNYWATDQIEERCYDFLTEVITATNPDFIILTGDVIYGEFDDSGTALVSLINFMDSFEIPWSPVFGNHDNESTKGADWQCEQLENSPYCYFEQKELTGNGNYSVAIAQGGEIKRVFYMLDSNGCGNVSAESMANGHTSTAVGFAQDQINWYTDQITELKEYVPDVKISFAYHIQQAVFGEAYAKYGFNQAEKYQDVNLDIMEGVAEGDFGYIGRQMKNPWDSSKSVYNGMKALGADSIFVGHEHCNGVSVVYDGIRFTYGLKSSEYDRFNFIHTNGIIEGGYGYAKQKDATSLIGGTVIVLSETDGTIEDCYNYYCGFENGQIDWEQYKTYEVNGLQYGGVNVTTAEMYADGAVTAKSVKFDDTTNAWKVTAGTQGKLYINTALMRGKTTFTFTLYMDSAVGQYELNPFAIRVKPDDGSGAEIAGMYESGSSKKQYIRYLLNTDVEEVRLELGVWKTYTVDITAIADGCTEFAFNIAAGNTLYIKDVTIS